MKPSSPSLSSYRTVFWSIVLAATPACYSGASPEIVDDDDTADPGAETGASQDTDGSPEDEDWEVPSTFEPDPGQIRLLSSDEYKHTIRDLLDIEVSSDLSYADVGSGYDNSSGSQLGESLFSILQTETERVAGEYVETGLAQAFPCFDPGAPVTDSCAQTVVDDLGRRAFRRPVDAVTRQQLLDFVAAITPEAQSSAEVMELLLTRMLMSPRFLYRTEIGTTMADEPTLALLDPFERASLLSYSIIGSMPDAPLLADAEADRLDLPTIREHVRRLIESDRGRAQMVKFFKQWLRVTELDSMADTPEDFPKLASAEQAQSLREEFRAFIESVVFEEQGTFGDLLTQNVAFVDKHTAALYGAESDSDTLVALDLDRTQRGGVLTLASVMAVHSSSSEIERDKPIRRGLVVKNQFLCEEIGLPSGIDPNAAAAEVMDDVPNFEELTTREQLELIMNQDELCVSCHTTFMPYGYLWSNFDALGQYNTHFGDRPLDSAVTDLFVNGNVGAYAGVMDFLPQLVDGEQSRLCFGENFVRYATGYAKGNLVTYLTEALAPITVDSDLNIVEFFQATFATQELYVREGN